MTFGLHHEFLAVSDGDLQRAVRHSVAMVLYVHHPRADRGECPRENRRSATATGNEHGGVAGIICDRRHRRQLARLKMGLHTRAAQLPKRQ